MKPTQPRRLAVALVATLLLAGLAASAQPPEPAFMRAVYPPELVMQKHREIGLRDDQRKAITKAIQETQAKTLEMQWAMQDAAQELGAEIQKPRVDEETALAAAERMMTIEGQVKRAHLALLIRIKNQLDPDQQEKLRALREKKD